MRISCVAPAILAALLGVVSGCVSAEPLSKELLNSIDGGHSEPSNGQGGETYAPGTGGDPSAASTGGEGFGGYPSSSGGSAEFASGGSVGTSTGGTPTFVFPPLPPPAPVVDAGSACANAICFDVFDCVIFHPGNTCGFTKCDGFICKP